MTGYPGRKENPGFGQFPTSVMNSFGSGHDLSRAEDGRKEQRL
jgi:hypothetical protein